jgi:2-amino-4-hydroxy-6-hydroxymethyldihydropteridine diphosphokinase
MPAAEKADASPVTAFVALGANLGDAQAALQAALKAMGGLPSTQLVRHSHLYRTAPVDADGPDYLNAVAELSTSLAPLELLDALQSLESQAGRERPYPNAPRTLDLDLLLYGDAQLATPRLTIPHRRMYERAFVLAPLAEIAPQHVAQAQLRALVGQRVERLSDKNSHKL